MMATHQISMIRNLADDEILFMKDGVIRGTGNPGRTLGCRASHAEPGILRDKLDELSGEEV